MIDQPLYLGIDLGTSGCRIIAIDHNDQIVAESESPIPPSVIQEKGVSQSPGDWWRAVNSAFAGLSHQLQRLNRSTKSISTIAIDSTSGSLLLSDTEGTPITPALMYNDQRPMEIVNQISAVNPNPGTIDNPNSALAKLLWWHHQGATSAARHALHPADWLSGKFTSRFGISDHNNALKLGYDVINKKWPEWIGDLSLKLELLPEIVEPGQSLGRISRSVSKLFDLSDKVEIIAGTTDSIATFLASGADQIGDGVTTLGTTLAVKLISQVAITNPAYGVYSHRLGSHWLVGGASNSGGGAIARYISLGDIKKLSGMIDPTQACNLNYYPLAAIGERFPIADPEMKSRIQTIPDQPATFLQGLFEGVAAVETMAYQRLEQLGGPRLQRLFSSGSGNLNSTWNTIRERMIGLTIQPNIHNQSAYGVARLAHHGCNITK